MAEANKKRKDLSLQEKQTILECYNKLPKRSQRIETGLLKILQPLLCKFLKTELTLKLQHVPIRTRIGREHDRGKIVTVSQHKNLFSNVR
jgi:hypothetical protein